jgi:dTDP-4-dehydrorhamnose reductase
MKILILGGNGLLGQTLFFYLKKNTDYEVFATIRNGKCIDNLISKELKKSFFENIDLYYPGKIEEIILKLKPDYIINCAGVLTVKDFNQTMSAIKINSELPHTLSHLSNKYKFKLIHFSTDGVFDGHKGNYSEEDQVIINDKYGMTKFLGEVVANQALTIRTSIIGHNNYLNKGLVNWFLNSKLTVNGFSDYIYSGLTTVELSKIIVKFILPSNKASGLYHLGSPPISKYDLLLLISKIYNKKTKIIPINKPKINRVLKTNRFIDDFGYQQTSWEKMILNMKKDNKENIRFFK